MASFYPHLYEAALKLLIAAREEAGLSQADLAARFGLTKRLVSSYETGSRLLDTADFIALCRAIGVDPYEVLRDAEQAAGTGSGPLIRLRLRSRARSYPEGATRTFLKNFGSHRRSCNAATTVSTRRAWSGLAASTNATCGVSNS